MQRKYITLPKRLALLLAAGFLISCSTTHRSKLSNDEIVSLVREAYLFASPLIYTDVTRVNSAFPDNSLYHLTRFPDHTFRQVVAPNNDTNYSLAFLELNEEPVVVDIPDTQGRYYVFPLQDAWTNNFVLPGKRTTGSGRQQYIITGPGWEGEIPPGLTQIKSPTNLVWIIGRIQVNSPEDQAEFVTPLQNRFKLATLSKWQSNDDSPATPLHKQYGDYLPPDAGTKSVVEVVENLPVDDYFNYFNELLADNAPAEADSNIVRRIAQVGIGAGQRFSLAAFDSATQEALRRIPAEVNKALDETSDGKNLFGTDTSNPEARTGDYKTDYNLRAFVARKGLGALPPEEAVYYSYKTDLSGEPLHGKNDYRIHFAKGQLPPAQAFWSYTVYDTDRYLVANPIRRYAIGDRNDLKYNKDGSLDLYLTAKDPGKGKTSNWLPTHEGEFNITLRIYIPTPDFLRDRSAWSDPKPENISSE
jgi:hypothetical protein